jgi:DNA-directed RNA polymerase specialized sigma24 family protein
MRPDDSITQLIEGIKAGDYSPDLPDRNGLWRLLSVTTSREAVDRFRHEQRQKRRFQGESSTLDNDSHAGTHRMDRICGPDPTPELAAMLVEDCERLLRPLEPDLRTMAVCRLEGRTNREIARRRRCSLSTVERRMQLIRKKWGWELPS